MDAQPPLGIAAFPGRAERAQGRSVSPDAVGRSTAIDEGGVSQDSAPFLKDGPGMHWASTVREASIRGEELRHFHCRFRVIDRRIILIEEPDRASLPPLDRNGLVRRLGDLCDRFSGDHRPVPVNRDPGPGRDGRGGFQGIAFLASTGFFRMNRIPRPSDRG